MGWIHVMRFIEAESAHVDSMGTSNLKKPQYRTLRTTGPHGLGVALMTWPQPFTEFRMATICRFNSMFIMNSTGVWKKQGWGRRRRPVEMPEESARKAVAAGFPTEEVEQNEDRSSEEERAEQRD